MRLPCPRKAGEWRKWQGYIISETPETVETP